jgi:type II secretory pathway pseudopilin PulG
MSKKPIIAIGAVGLVAIVAAAVLPNYIRARNTPASNACVSNLRCIDGATEQWALDNGKTTNDYPAWEDVRPYVSRDGRIPVCPQGGKYTLGRLGKPTTCSYRGHTMPQ